MSINGVSLKPFLYFAAQIAAPIAIDLIVQHLFKAKICEEADTGITFLSKSKKSHLLPLSAGLSTLAGVWKTFHPGGLWLLSAYGVYKLFQYGSAIRSINKYLNQFPEGYFPLQSANFNQHLNPNSETFPAMNKAVQKGNLSELTVAFFQPPPELEKNVHLVTLQCYVNNLIRLPLSVTKITNLRQLHLDGNPLLDLPPDIQNLKKLRVLVLRNSRLARLPREISNLTNLQELNLNSCRFQEFPSSICKLVNLKSLYFNKNQLRALPNTISNLRNLESLELSENELEVLPDALGKLYKLQRLFVEQNRLTSLPISIIKLSHCSIFAEQNRFGAAAVRSMQGAANRYRLDAAHVIFVNVYEPPRSSALWPQQNSAPSFKDVLLAWLHLFTASFPDLSKNKERFPSQQNDESCLTFYQPLFEHPKKDILHNFLLRLEQVKDFTEGGNSKTQVIWRAGSMLERAADHETFRKAVFLLLEDALATCNDRVNIVFDKIEVQWHLSRANNLSEVDLARLLISITSLDLIEKQAWKRIEELHRVDPIEVLLFYHTKCKEALRLPISTKSMLHREIGEVPQHLWKEDQEIVLKQTSSLQSARTDRRRLRTIPRCPVAFYEMRS